MARMKISDLHKDMKISKEEMKNVDGGAVDTFLKINGIPGDSTDDKHKDQIEVLSCGFSWGVEQQ